MRNAKYMEIMDNRYKVKCKCGHTMILVNRFGRFVCNWCGNYVYKDKQTEFKYKMKELLR